MKDYYQILEVSPESAEEDIRRKYRQLAMRYHPDRNPDDPAAEEKFKEIAEAYGVLTDPVKRREYDAARRSGRTYQENGAHGFAYSQEDILRDLFRDPRFQQMFQGVLREFQRSGFRASPQFIRKSFFGGRGGLFLGGLFLFGSLAGPVLKKSAQKSLSKNDSIFKRIGRAVGTLLSDSRPEEKKLKTVKPANPSDIVYVTALLPDELRQGKVVQVVTEGPDGQELLKVTIPAGSRDGQKLRLKGKGAQGPDGRGDLFLQLEKR